MVIMVHLILIIWFGIKLSISILKKDENEQATLGLEVHTETTIISIIQ